MYGGKPTKLQGPGKPTEAYFVKKAALEKRVAKTGRKMKHLAVDMQYEWLATGKEGKIFITVFSTDKESLSIPNCPYLFKRAYLQSDSSQNLSFKLEGETLVVSLPEQSGAQLPYVICFE